VSDERLRRLEREAALGDPEAEARLSRERARTLSVRDPRRDPIPGDVVRSGTVTRRVLRCGTATPSGYQGSFFALGCPMADGRILHVNSIRTGDAKIPHVHYGRVEGSTGYRCGTMRIRSWRAWARHGTVPVRGDA
jgi:hypothetical protein